MNKRNHASRETAIREAMKNGYWPRHSTGVLVLSDGKHELAIQRETRPRSTAYHLVKYEPANPL